jgi:hypothetical protein
MFTGKANIKSSGLDAETGTETETGTGIGAETGAGAEIGTDTDTEVEPETEAETEGFTLKVDIKAEEGPTEPKGGAGEVTFE